MPNQTLLQRQLPPLRSREEMIQLLLDKEYGHMPQIPYTMEVSEPKIVDKRYCCGNAQYSYVNMTITTEYGKAVDFRLWQNYGKRRIYCSLGNAYIDLSDGRIYAKGSAKEACERFLEMYTVA